VSLLFHLINKSTLPFNFSSENTEANLTGAISRKRPLTFSLYPLT
jgi:hypothetical protein